MPLPRFQKLEKFKKDSILHAAAAEFAELGFDAASYNRIIDRAGISKGAMYYYFADKDDLYCTVLDAATALWFERMEIPGAVDSAEAFWRECEAIYARILHFFLAEPQSAGICWSVARVRHGGGGHPALLELNRKLLDWTATLVRLGQRVGAVRDDIPLDLLLELAFSMLLGMDRWLASHWEEMSVARVDHTVHMLVGLIRRTAESFPEESHG